jgi:copper homeostasis protein
MTTNGTATMLEIIALDAEDARAATAGGADRLEIVSAIDLGGLTPTLATFERIRAATTLPLRVMLRTNGGYRIAPDELDVLCTAAAALRRAGADQFVLGFLDADGDIDRVAIAALGAVIAPCPWTFHRAFDQITVASATGAGQVADARAAWATVAALPGADLILSSGGPGELGAGVENYRARASWQTPGLRWLAGGGLEAAHIAPLRAAGIAQFHAGRLVRAGESWARPIDAAAVAVLRARIVSGT